MKSSIILFVFVGLVYCVADPNTKISSSTPSPVPAVDTCQQTNALNVMLLQLLLQTQATTQNPLIAGLNRLLSLQSPANEINALANFKPTPRVVTTHEVSTITEVNSKVLSLRMGNRKIPTTIFTSSVFVVTEIKTVTLDVEPTARFRREVEDHDEINEILDPSFDSFDEEASFSPAPAPHDVGSQALMASLGLVGSEHQLSAAMQKPQVQKAWVQLMDALVTILQTDGDESSIRSDHN